MLVMLRPELPERVMAAESFIVHRHPPFIAKPNGRVGADSDVNRAERAVATPDQQARPRREILRRATAGVSAFRPRLTAISCNSFHSFFREVPSLAKLGTAAIQLVRATEAVIAFNEEFVCK